MKVVTFNIRYTDDANGHSIAERAPRLFQIFKKHSPDIIGLQEVTPQWLEVLTEGISKEYSIFNKFRGSYSAEGSTIIFKKDKFNLIDKGYFWFSKIPWVESFGGDSYNCNRICQWVLLEEKTSLKRFYYLNLHFGFGTDYQLMSVEILKQTTDLFGTDNIIITGDFNLTPDTDVYKRLVECYTDVNTVTKCYKGTTYHNYGMADGQHIDYCFIKNGDFSPYNYTLLDETFNNKFPSDHYGIMVDFEIKK